MKIPWKEANEESPVSEEQYQERFWRRRLDGEVRRRGEKAKVSRKALVTGGSTVEKQVKVREHTYTKSQTYSYGRKAKGRVAEDPV